MNDLILVLGNQLFEMKKLQLFPKAPVFMAEDYGLCTHFKYHKHKIMHFLTSMREYRDLLVQSGFEVHYSELKDSSQPSFIQRLQHFIDHHKIMRIYLFEVEDKFFEEELINFAQRNNLELVVQESPSFMVTRENFRDYLGKVKKPFMKTFYEQQRKNLSILIDEKKNPIGGQWSFDAENRKKMPKGHKPPLTPPGIKKSKHLKAVSDLVNELFTTHPGKTEHFWLPCSHQEAQAWLDNFIHERLLHFGDYQDSLSTKEDFLYHSLISPSINIGHLTPHQVVDKVIEVDFKNKAPLNSIEGFTRQVLGWREFVRGIYQEYDEIQQAENFFNHQRQLAPSWYSGETGIPPLDFMIHKLNRYGYAHHIERLMVASNMMLLSEVHPQAAYRWFMELFVDSSDWVMGPNVFGMGLFSDGGIFATKPYICGSNYWRKMGDFPAGPWCDIVDGLYWRFIDKHRVFLLKQHRLSMMVRTLDKMEPARKKILFQAAESFIDKHTLMAKGH
jgi:deoxyribodipyrimidine photolyase-related protein